MYEDMTMDVIMEEMMEEMPDGLDTSEGSLIYHSCAKHGARLEEVYTELSALVDNQYSDTYIDSNALPYCRILSAIRLPVMADMMTRPSATGTRLSRPSRQSNTSKRTNRPMGVAIALYLSGS